MADGRGQDLQSRESWFGPRRFRLTGAVAGAVPGPVDGPKRHDASEALDTFSSPLARRYDSSGQPGLPLGTLRTHISLYNGTRHW